MKKEFKFNIYQQCLENQINEIKNIYKKFNIKYELFTFSKDMMKYYQKTDLAITRSGASSLAELTNLRIPFIAIPLPTSADNHQFMNANYFRKKGYCFLLEEKFIFDNLHKILVDLSKKIRTNFKILRKRCHNILIKIYFQKLKN